MKRILLPLTVATVLSACSTSSLVDSLPDNRPNYKTSRTTNPLEIPPNLTQSSVDDSLNVSELSGTANASLSAYQGERRNGKVNGVSNLENSLRNIQTQGGVSWIVINAKPSAVFNTAKRFWQDNGLVLSRVDAGIGIMETDWLESEKNSPKSGISAIIGRIVNGLTDDGVRDKFRTRVDFDGTNSTVHITHSGATEEQMDRYGKIIQNNQTKSNKSDSNSYKWVPGTRNSELEIEMLRRMNLYLHKRGKATAQPSVTTQKSSKIGLGRLADGTPALVVEDSFNRAWMLLGVAIERAGFNLSNQNRQNGLYGFEKVTEEKTGFIIKKVKRNIVAYQLGLSDQGSQQVAVVRSINGRAPTAEQALSILQNISQKIRF